MLYVVSIILGSIVKKQNQPRAVKFRVSTVTTKLLVSVMLEVRAKQMLTCKSVSLTSYLDSRKANVNVATRHDIFFDLLVMPFIINGMKVYFFIATNGCNVINPT